MVVLGAEDATRDDTSDGATKADAEDTHAAAITADFIFGNGLGGEMERVTKGLCERSRRSINEAGERAGDRTSASCGPPEITDGNWLGQSLKRGTLEAWIWLKFAVCLPRPLYRHRCLIQP